MNKSKHGLNVIYLIKVTTELVQLFTPSEVHPY
jgi:hypothetical protein